MKPRSLAVLGAIVRKDALLLWPLVVLMAVVQVVLEWSLYKSAFFGVNPVAGEIVQLLVIPWFIGVVALSVAPVLEDPVPGADQDWLVRPIPRTALLLSKMLFAILALCVPMFVVNTAQQLALGFPAVPSILDAMYKEAYLFVCLIVPAMALAAINRNLSELVVALAALIVLYALSLASSGLLFGADRCPTCGTGLSWMQHLLQHVIVFAGSIWILWLQYYRRATRSARAVAAAGTVLLVFVQVPWSVAFSIQSRLDAAHAADALQVALGSPQAPAPGQRGERGPSIARRTTQAFLHGNVDAAVDSLQRFRSPGETPITITYPVRITGTVPGELVVADRVLVSVLDSHDAVVYRGMNAVHSTTALQADPDSGAITQAVEIPREIYARVEQGNWRVRLDYSLTRMRISSQNRMRAIDGELRDDVVGLCQTRPGDLDVRVVCRRIGLAPSCYSVTLHGPGGLSNRPTLSCRWDYRPYIPSPLAIVSLNALSIPVRDPTGIAHFAVNTADLADAYIDLRSYEAVEHIKRTVYAQIPAP